MMLVAVILILQCLQVEMVELNMSSPIEADYSVNTNADSSDPKQSSSYRESQVLIKGQNITTSEVISNSETPLADKSNHGEYSKSDELLMSNSEAPLRYIHAHLLSKVPLKYVSLYKSLKNERNKEFISESSAIKNSLNIKESMRQEKQTNADVNKWNLNDSKMYQRNPQQWPSNSYASASSWAGSYGRPSSGAAAANAQASALAGDSSASSSSGTSSGGYYSGGSGPDSGSIPQSNLGRPSSSDSYYNNHYKQNITTNGNNAGSGGHYNYYRPPLPNTDASSQPSYSSGFASSGGTASQSSAPNSGYNRPTFTSGSSVSSSFSGGYSPSNAGSNYRPGNYYNGYNPSSGSSGHQGYAYKPTGSTSGASSGGNTGPYSSYNKPSSSSSSGSGSNYSNYYKPTTSSTGNYNPYSSSRPSSSDNSNYYKPSSNTGGTTSSAGYGSYYGSYNKPTTTASEPQQNINNKPSQGATGAYYNGYYITTSPNSGSEGHFTNKPSGEIKPSIGIVVPITSLSGSSSGVSSNIGILTGGGISNSVTSSVSSTPSTISHVPWWLEAGVFTTGTIMGNFHGVMGSGSSSIAGNNNFGAGSSVLLGSGGVTNSGNQVEGLLPGVISGSGPTTGPILGSNNGVLLPPGPLVGSGNVGGPTLVVPINGGGLVTGVINNNLGPTSTGNQISPAIPSGTQSGNNQLEINSSLNPEIPSNVGATNSGTMPWWFLTGVFSASVDHPNPSQTGSSTDVGPTNGVLLTTQMPGTVIIPQPEPVNNVGPSGGNIVQQIQSSQSNAESSNGFGSNINIESTSSTGSSSGTLTAVDSHPGENVPDTGLVLGPTKPGELPITVNSQTDSMQLNSHPESPPLGPFSSGLENRPLGEIGGSPQQVFLSAGNIQSASGFAIPTAVQDNSPIVPPMQSHVGYTAQEIPPAGNNPSSSGTVFTNISSPTVTDVATSPRPQGWSGGENGPATLIGFQTKPSSGHSGGSGAGVSSSFSGQSTNNYYLPYKASEEESNKPGPDETSPQKLLASENEQLFGSSKQYHTVFSENVMSSTDRNLLSKNSSSFLVKVSKKEEPKITSHETGELMKSNGGESEVKSKLGSKILKQR